MAAVNLTDVERAFRDGWGADTCCPDDLHLWHEANPSRGQCAATTLVVHDLLGGELILAKAYRAGRQRGYHWWNRLPCGVELDLTREQFDGDEVVGEGRRLVRPPGQPRRYNEQYVLLRARVFGRIDRSSPLASVRST